MKCAFYEREITPPLGESMPGYYMARIAEDVQDKLYAKAFAAESGGERIALVVLDCVELPTKYADAIVSSVMEYNDIPESFKGMPIVLITAGLMAIAFCGFSGLL